MKTKGCECVQTINNCYVNNDCVEVMVPHLGHGITIFNAEKIVYHYSPNSDLFINDYLDDNRKNQFPYYQIPTHLSFVRGRKVEYINQLYNFNTIYIEITDGKVIESFSLRDGRNALLVRRNVLPVKENEKIMSRDNVNQLILSANGGILGFDAGIYENFSLMSDSNIVDLYRDQLIGEITKNKKGKVFKNEHFYKILDSLSIADVPKGLTVLDDAILVVINNNEITSIQSIVVRFASVDQFIVEISSYPLKYYNLEELKELKDICLVKTMKPKFPRILNHNIDRYELKNEKKVLKLLSKNNNIR